MNKTYRRRYKNKFSNKLTILIRKTGNHIYCQFRSMEKIILNEFNTHNIKGTMKNKYEYLNPLIEKYVLKNNFYNYYTDIFSHTYGGYIKKILDNVNRIKKENTI